MLNLSVCLFVYLSACPSAYLSVYFSLSLPLSLLLLTSLFISRSLRLSVGCCFGLALPFYSIFYFVPQVFPSLHQLVMDPSDHVRQALAAVMNDMAPVLGSEHTMNHLLPMLLTLLRDTNPEVLFGFITVLPHGRDGNTPCFHGSSKLKKKKYFPAETATLHASRKGEPLYIQDKNSFR